MMPDNSFDASYEPEGDSVLAGDWADDDAQAVDELLTTVSHVEPVPLPTVQAKNPVEGPAPTTRILGGRTVLAVTNGPVQLLPADPARSALRIFIRTTTPLTDAVAWSSEESAVNSTGAASAIYEDAPVVMGSPGCHTGAIWVKPIGTPSGPIYVFVETVTF